MRAAFFLVPLLLLAVPRPCPAFLFGRDSEKKALDAGERMRAAFEEGNCASVQENYTALLNEKPSRALREAAYGYLGRCYEADGLPDKAISLYKLALELFPDNILFASRLGQIYNRAGFFESAEPLFLKVLALKSDDLDANLGLARAYSGLGFLARAGEFYSITVALQDFGDAAVLREYAACLLKKRDWKEAEFIAGQGRLREPDSAFWPVAEARIMAGRGDYDKAVSNMDAAVKLEPSRSRRLERALYQLLGGRQEEAMAEADAALAADKTDALAASVKALALYTLGEKKEAGPYFETAAADGGNFTAKLAQSFIECAKNGGAWPCKK